ncbi:MAG: hypothetical protein ICV84_19255 [Flavisolibacter sp.]|nr:hypothetical protein [Flavisolibacter sp.]
MEFEFTPIRRNVDEDEIIADIKEVARQLNQHTLTFKEYDKHGKFNSSTAGCDSKLRGQNSKPNILWERVVEPAGRAHMLPSLRSDFTAIKPIITPLLVFSPTTGLSMQRSVQLVILTQGYAACCW